MEEILSSIKRIIAEDKAIDADPPAPARKKIAKPALKAVPDIDVDDDDTVLELTNEVSAENEHSGAKGVFGDRRRETRLIDEKKLDSMRQSLSALVTAEKSEQNDISTSSQGTSLEDLTRELLRPMLKEWLDQNLPQLVEELVAQEIARLKE